MLTTLQWTISERVEIDTCIGEREREKYMGFVTFYYAKLDNQLTRGYRYCHFGKREREREREVDGFVTS